MSVQNTNVTAVFLMCRAFIPTMKGAGYGRILNMTSIMSHRLDADASGLFDQSEPAWA